MGRYRQCVRISAYRPIGVDLVKVVKYYPDSWTLAQARAYKSGCEQNGNIPPHAKFKTKRIYRKKLIKLTWKWT